jgi:hypothetical protein
MTSAPPAERHHVRRVLAPWPQTVPDVCTSCRVAAWARRLRGQLSRRLAACGRSLRAVVARDLSDAQVPGLSTDRQFATADNAALQLRT